MGLTADDAKAWAEGLTGLSDFGGNSYLEGLKRNLEALGSLPLKPAARNQIEGAIVNDLANRLRIQDWLSRTPTIAQADVEGPVFVTGLPRTGTTATIALLALDPRFRFTRAWEGRTPVPPPELENEDDDPRAVAARTAANRLTHAAMHLSDPDGPEEDLVLLAGLDCRSYHGRLPMPDEYLAWWASDDFRSTYAWHRRALQLLQSKRPPTRWLLKSPLHLFKLDTCAEQYPNAKFVMTHRDPVKVVSSVASFSHTLYEDVCEPGSDPLNKLLTGRRCLAFWSDGVRRGLESRARLGEDRFIDVHNRDIIADPVGTLERVYDRLEMTVAPELKARWTAFQADNAKGKFGAHEHHPIDFGLSDTEIRTAFSDYIEKFDL